MAAHNRVAVSVDNVACVGHIQAQGSVPFAVAGIYGDSLV
jgi:hypothetical protein